jgi:hypothetical protein
MFEEHHQIVIAMGEAQDFVAPAPAPAHGHPSAAGRGRPVHDDWRAQLSMLRRYWWARTRDHDNFPAPSRTPAPHGAGAGHYMASCSGYNGWTLAASVPSCCS